MFLAFNVKGGALFAWMRDNFILKVIIVVTIVTYGVKLSDGKTLSYKSPA